MTNHGGVAVIAAPGINLSPVNAVLDDPTTFEYVCVRISTGQFAAIIVVVYRPGSSAVQTTFFDELSSVLEVVATFQEAVYVVGDFNVRLGRYDDPITVQFTELLVLLWVFRSSDYSHSRRWWYYRRYHHALQCL